MTELVYEEDERPQNARCVFCSLRGANERIPVAMPHGKRYIYGHEDCTAFWNTYWDNFQAKQKHQGGKNDIEPLA